jgi:hypothetical protein
MPRTRLLATLAGVATAAAVLTAGAGAGDGHGHGRDNDSGFRTPAAPLLAPVKAGVSVKPIITVGESLPGGYRFESIPDGIALKTRGHGRVDVWVNHETSTVPFPYDASTGVGFNDFTNAMVSRLTLNQHSAGVLHGTYDIPSDANYQRFCSSFLATEKHGFDRDILFTNEEATDFGGPRPRATPRRSRQASSSRST